MSATEEVAITIRPLVDNLAKLTGPLCDELGVFFGDKARAFRQRNLGTVVDGAVKRLEDAGKQAGPVPPRVLLPLIDAASLEDNPTLQEMWMGLLASASDRADDMSPSYVETLKNLTPHEARSVKVLYDFSVQSFGTSLGSDEEASQILMFRLGLAVGEAIAPRLIIETLERLGLIRREYNLDRNRHLAPLYPAYSSGEPLQQIGLVPPSVPQVFFTGFADTHGRLVDIAKDEREPLPKVVNSLVFTSYGVQFMRACEGPKPLVPDVEVHGVK